MQLEFDKMHGLGNDFVVVDNTDGRYRFEPDRVRRLGDRRRGVGFDQMLVVESAPDAGADLAVRIFNADGNQAEQCGNGMRCVALFAVERGLVTGDSITLDTAAGRVRARRLEPEIVEVEMTVPDFAPERIPLLVESEAPSYALSVDGVRVEFGAVSMGNPHAVLEVDDVERAEVSVLGPAVQACDRFPEGVNVGFMQAIGPGHIRLRVYERGVGETLACGSGACAAVAIGCRQQRLDAEVEVDLPGGRLHVEWSGPGNPVSMRGPAAMAFRGRIEL